MYLSILLLPLCGSLLATNRKTGNLGGPILSIICISITTLLATIAFWEVGLNGSTVSLKLGYWIKSNYLNLEWSLLFDSLTVSMFIPVLYISSLVQIYSLGYMDGDPHISRFYSYLSLFSFFMLILITGENLLVLFLGWEGVGLASYLLINFWFTRIAANMAALKAFLMNRIGDWALSLGLLLTIALTADLSFATIFSLASYLNTDLILILAVLLLIGASAKSAQLGLHSWLASAMEGPTPVSALIHAATMVTAGVYLLMRFSPLLEWSSTSLQLVAWLGGLSALLGAAASLLENDIKRVIAYSTTSQLGYMVVACGLSQFNIGLFHLINHAFFKGLLFLSAGAVLHALMDEQDMRRMGSLVLLIPKTYAFILIGSLSLMALPFLTGFYSKDFILEMALIPHNTTNTMACILALVAALLTGTYSARLMILTFLSEPHFPSTLLPEISDPVLSSFISLSLLLASIAAVFLGFLTNELFLGIDFFLSGQSLFIHPDHLILLDGTLSPASIWQFLPPLTLLTLITILPFSFTFPAVFTRHKICNAAVDQLLTSTQSKAKVIQSLGVSTFSFSNPPSINVENRENKKNPSPSRRNHTLSFGIGTLSGILNHFNIYTHWIIYNTLNLGVILHRHIDRGLIELIGPTGLINLIHYLGFRLELLATGYLPHYAFLIIGCILTFTLLCLSSILILGPPP
uniref:NADH-ubiquinone oxidoreductase chain 5 n=1 Tax=Synchytrium endobioticum TaxID=286115 RepID=A0A4P8NND3_9FUNG|nr:NADH dehydrogenase subunit 5 [Synchytrium endobioticum]QCQ68470.1 NADH dehydrogenase subunit 5 [Synchytrium endobioticum]QCQ68489.1 NADH dehydrogenase subunit 5 [Synchytrium endobioticum]QCQ68508.1 NADH dehydrogenase subunit 5 [Synchytrium endobioticum]QCQ68527.1 NADH dehydrogenase subunit 5 [Synchytrium endobioticum]